MKAYYHLPGLFEYFEFYKTFMMMYNSERDKFNDWCEIGSIYGAPFGAIWNGGRANQGSCFYEELVVDFAKENDVPCRLTFSNPLLNKNHLLDTQCNALLEKFYFGDKNSIIINSPILEEYIRDNYPNYKIISSTTKCIKDKDKAIQEINKDYYMTVLDYNFNNNFDFLNSIEHKEKCELLINPVCQPNCPRRAEHYEYIAKQILHKNSKVVNFECQSQGKMFYDVKESPLFISVDDIQNKYLPLGFQHFKIEGRTAHPLDLIEILVYYLIKPEHQSRIRERLLLFAW